MGNEQTKQLQQKTMQLTASKKKVTRVKQGSRVAAEENLKIATIPDILNDDQFLNDNHYNIFIVSAKDALLYANNEPLEGGNYKFDRKSKKIIRLSWNEAKNLSWNERLYISDESVKRIIKTQEDGKERLLVFVVDFYNGNGRGEGRLVVLSEVPFGYDARVAGWLGGSTQEAPKTLSAELIDAFRGMYYTIKRRA
jgi:dipeptidyl aminopeptidase/acylaminoacyl peptidase